MMDESETDAQLVSRALDGDRAAFAALVSRHYDFIFRCAWKWCGDRDDAQDIAQDVCVRLAKALRSWSGQGQLQSWLYRVVLNAVRDFQRARASAARKIDAYSVEPTRPSVQPAVDAEDDETVELWNLVRRLPPKQRDALLLVFSEGMSHAQAAEVLDCAPGTVSSNIHDGKKALKQMMAQDLDAPGKEQVSHAG